MTVSVVVDVTIVFDPLPKCVIVLPDTLVPPTSPLTLVLEMLIDELEEVEVSVVVVDTDDDPPWLPEVYDEEELIVTESSARPVTAKMARHDAMGRASERPNSFMVACDECCELCR